MASHTGPLPARPTPWKSTHLTELFMTFDRDDGYADYPTLMRLSENLQIIAFFTLNTHTHKGSAAYEAIRIQKKIEKDMIVVQYE